MDSAPAAKLNGICASRLPAVLLGLVWCAWAASSGPALAAQPGSAASSDPPRYEIGPAPAWTIQHPVPQAGGQIRSSDIEYLLVDRQLQFAETFQLHQHYVLRMLNESGVQSFSQLSIDFDPEVEKLRVHQVTLRRGTQVIDGLAAGRIEVLQRERDLERNLLNGALTFHLLLADVRVGDTLEYSFTRERRDAEWGNRHYAHLSTAWSIPVRASRLRLRVPADAPFHYASSQREPPAESRDGTWRVLEWNWKDLAGKPPEAGSPSWHEEYPSIELSQFPAWRDVLAPALQLYAGQDAAGAAVTAQVEKLRAAGGNAARALAAIRFVQEEIRYTGLELGAGAFRPTAPEIVLQRRYGDCKDKVLLAATLLRQLGIEATPALVSTTWRSHLTSRLPSPGAFDHVILRVRLGDSHYWWDATATAQGGDLAGFVQSDLGAALVIDPGSTGIATIPLAIPRSPLVTVNMVYDLRSGLDKTSALAVTTTYVGSEADAMRRKLRGQTIAELGLEYENYYRRIYPRAQAAGAPQVADDSRANILRIEERYEVQDLFEDTGEPDGQRLFSLDADLITSNLVAPSTPVRSGPLWMPYPRNATVKIEVRLPEDWPVEPEDVTIEDRFFRFSARQRRVGNDVFLEYGYRTLADHIPAAQLAGHLQRRERARQKTYFEFSYTPGEYNAAADLAQRGMAIFRLSMRQSPEKTEAMIEELRQSLQWDQASDELRATLAILSAGIAENRRDWKRAHEELRQAITASDDASLWSRYALASINAREYDDAADAVATLLERWPEEFRKLEDDVVARAAGSSEGSNRYRLLTLMFGSDYSRKDELDSSWLWFDLLQLQVERGEAAAARRTVTRIQDPSSLIKIMADNRFETVRRSLSPDQEFNRATNLHLSRLRALAERHPRQLLYAVELAVAQMNTLRHQEALQTLDGVLKRARQPDGAEYFTDHDERMRWILDYRSTALRDLGRLDEALAQLLEAQAAAGDDDTVSQRINLAGLYNRMKRPADARAHIAGFREEQASDYGRMMAASVRAHSAMQLGDAVELERQLEYLQIHQRVAPMSYLRALVAAGRLDDAAAQLSRLLADPAERSEVLLAAQDYPETPSTPWDKEVDQRWQELVARPQVRREILRFGTIGTYRWNP